MVALRQDSSINESIHGSLHPLKEVASSILASGEFLSLRDNPAQDSVDPTLARTSPHPTKFTVTEGLSPSSSTLTGYYALADARKARSQNGNRQSPQPAQPVSPNPNAEALKSLMGDRAISKVTMTTIPPTLKKRSLENLAETSNLKSPSRPKTSDPNGFDNATDVALRDESNKSDSVDGMEVSETEEEPRVLTYPPQSPSDRQEEPDTPTTAVAGSFDSATPRTAPKRHKCPFCDTDFTRHHNLKSHLLTHSQEKPFNCQTCPLSFRRLHDLKRHSKLHTGERNHMCDRCGRKFARGDALARHNKGPGGCANRKLDVDGEEEDEEEEEVTETYQTMDGIEYDNPNADVKSNRRKSETSRKRPHPDDDGEDSTMVNKAHSLTYPPLQQLRPLRLDVINNMAPPYPYSNPSPNTRVSIGDGSVYPPPPLSSTSNTPYPSSAINYTQPTPSFTTAPVLESPRPLSPRSQDPNRSSLNDMNSYRSRATSLTGNFFSSHNASNSIGTNNNNLPSPSCTTGPATKLPPLPSLVAVHHASQNNGNLAGQKNMNLPSPSHVTHPLSSHVTQIPPVNHSNPGSYSSHGHSSIGSGRELSLTADNTELWSYIRKLECRMSRMQDEYELRIQRLQNDVTELKTQVFPIR